MSNYDNTVIYRKGASRSNTGIQDGDQFVKEIEDHEFVSKIEWKDNVKFPAVGLETEE